MDLLDPLGDVVDVVMESSHDSEPGLARRPVSRAYGHGHLEEHPLRLRDRCSCTTAAPEWPRSIPTGRWKCSSTSTSCCSSMPTTSSRSRKSCISYGLKRDDTLKFISEAEHLHSTDDVYHEQFEEILYRLGIDR